MNPGALAYTLFEEFDRALLFRRLATLRTDIPLFDSVDELQWKGPTDAFEPLAARLDGKIQGSKLLAASATLGNSRS